MTTAPAPVANLRNKDFIQLKDFSQDDLEQILELALAMKQGRNQEKYLLGQNIGLIFMMRSTRIDHS